MRGGVWAAVVAAPILGYGTAWAACPKAEARDCVVNFLLVPQISQQIVAGEHVDPPPAKTRAPEPKPAYTGPTIGTAPNLGRAPEIGYRWSIN